MLRQELTSFTEAQPLTDTTLHSSATFTAFVLSVLGVESVHTTVPHPFLLEAYCICDPPVLGTEPVHFPRPAFSRFTPFVTYQVASTSLAQPPRFPNKLFARPLRYLP